MAESTEANVDFMDLLHAGVHVKSRNWPIARVVAGIEATVSVDANGAAVQ